MLFRSPSGSGSTAEDTFCILRDVANTEPITFDLESPLRQPSLTGALLPQKVPTVRAVGPVIAQDAPSQGNLGFIHAFVASISVIIVSELGDKTFFIAAIMAMRYNRLTVLAGAMLALGLMTCLSGAWMHMLDLSPVCA